VEVGRWRTPEARSRKPIASARNRPSTIRLSGLSASRAANHVVRVNHITGRRGLQRYHFRHRSTADDAGVTDRPQVRSVGAPRDRPQSHRPFYLPSAHCLIVRCCVAPSHLRSSYGGTARQPPSHSARATSGCTSSPAGPIPSRTRACAPEPGKSRKSLCASGYRH
jgi:hypothetical protein